MHCQPLHQESKEKVRFFSYSFEIHTVSLIPKSSRTLAKAAAGFIPECDFVTSTRLRSIEMGVSSCMKWTVNSTKALWLGDVHASMAKFN